VQVLQQLSDAYENKDKATIEALEPEATRIGMVLNNKGGQAEMHRVWRLVHGRGVALLQQHWAGIGDWKSPGQFIAELYSNRYK
jgi:hypothetical protein